MGRPFDPSDLDILQLCTDWTVRVAPHTDHQPESEDVVVDLLGTWL